MRSSQDERDELETRLEELHAASFGWACACCGSNETEAEDVLQTTYMKVISGKARYGGKSAFRTWLFGVIRLTAHEHQRRLRSQRVHLERLAVEMQGSGHVHEARDPVEDAELANVLREALDTLPGRQGEVLHLVFYQDLTIREAADVMEVSVGSARVHYDRGKKKLRALLSDTDAGGGAL